MLQWEHSAILSTFIKLPFSIKTFVLSIFKWSLKTGFTVSNLKGLKLIALSLLVKTCDFFLLSLKKYVVGLKRDGSFEYLQHMGLVVRKPVFGVSEKSSFKPASSATQTG